LNFDCFDFVVNDKSSSSELEIHAASVLNNWISSIHGIEHKSVLTYSVECPAMNVVFAKSGDYFSVEILE
jgi:c-di-GMP-binding flagellar brake protein YcgR